MPERADTSTAGAPVGSRSLRWITLVLATACGLSVANIPYAQPPLDLIAKTFHTSHGSTTVVVTMTQLGYAAGLIVLLPPGDLLENRALASLSRATRCSASATSTSCALMPGPHQHRSCRRTGCASGRSRNVEVTQDRLTERTSR